MSLTPLKSSLQFFFISCLTSISTDPHQREKNNSIKTRKAISNKHKIGNMLIRDLRRRTPIRMNEVYLKPIVVMLKAAGLSFFISHRNLQNVR